MRTALLLTSALAVAIAAGCHKKPTGTIMDPKNYDAPLPPGEVALRRITDPSQIPDFTAACQPTENLRQAVGNSLNYLAKPSSRRHFPYGRPGSDVCITHAHAVASLEAFAQLLASGCTPAQMNAALRERFDVYISVGCDNQGTVLFTGYYTPIFEASPVRTGRFRYPLYGPPAGLEKDEEGGIRGIRQADGSYRPVPDRRMLETTGVLAGNELVWLSDPFEVYVAQVQGSTILRMPDGSHVPYGYVASNGHEYVSIGRKMADDGKFPSGRPSLQGMIAHFKAHPEDITRYTWQNPRFVFFGPMTGPPRGSLNEPVLPWRSIATDKSVFPRACLAFLQTQLPRPTPSGPQLYRHHEFALDQDTGGGIRAAGRCDVYMGVGETAAGIAGRTSEEGKLYYLFLKTPPAGPATAPAAP